MKKIIALLLTLLLCVAGVAAAEDGYKPGQSVTVYYSIVENAGGAGFANIVPTYNSNVFELVEAVNAAGMQVNVNYGGQMEVSNTQAPLAVGAGAGRVVLKIKTGATPGDYWVGAQVNSSYGFDGQSVTKVKISSTRIKVLAEHTHSYTAVVTDPTCTEDGYTTYTCSCGDSYVDDEVAALGHSWDEGEVVEPATCQQKAEFLYTCTVCGETKTEYGEYGDHVWNWDAGERTPGTCIDPEVTVYPCIFTGCTETYMEIGDKDLSPNGHDYVQGELLEANCQYREYEYTCSRCGDTVVGGDMGNYGPHKFGEWTKESAATSCLVKETWIRYCTVQGCDAFEIEYRSHGYHNRTPEVTTKGDCKTKEVITYTCVDCGSVFVEEGELGDHVMGEGVVTPATCKEYAKTVYTCTVCGETVEEVGTEYADHTWGEGVVTPATCKEYAKTVYTCSVCGETKEEIGTEYAEHVWGEGVVTPATCKEYAKTVYTCSVCGETKEEIGTEYAEHVWGEGVVTPATCTEAGKTVYTCSVCGETKEEVIAATGEHTWGEGVVTPATCTEAGKTVYTCSVCGETKEETIAAAGHKWGEGVTTPATCTEDGKTVYTCSVCGETKEETIAATGKHTYGEGVTTPATCKDYAVTVYTCTVCGETATITGSEYADHTWGEGVVTPATCTEAGKTVYTCSVCGETKSEPIPATGHNYEAVVTAPTCTEAGYTTYTCACGDTYTADEVAAIGHNYESTYYQPATCTKNGSLVETCSNCGDEKVVTLWKLGHDADLWTVVKSVTEDAAGEEQRVCKRCGEVLETRAITESVVLTDKAHTSGVYFRDVSKLTENAEMFTVLDLTVDGEYTFDMVAANEYIIGTVTVKVQDGKFTVSYNLVSDEIKVTEEFMTVVSGLEAITSLDKEAMTKFNFNEEITVDGTIVLLYVENACEFRNDVVGLKHFEMTEEYTKMVEEMMEKAQLTLIKKDEE